MTQPLNPESLAPLPPARRSGSWKGCLLAFLLGFLLLLGVLGGGTYYTIFYSALPFRLCASLLEAGGKKSQLQIDGVTGSITTGLAIKSTKWNTGEVADVRVRSDNWRQLARKQELHFEEIHVGKAHLDFSSWSTQSEAQAQSETQAKPPESSPTAQKLSTNWLLSIDELTLSDLLLTNQRTGFRLEIPKLKWTDIRVGRGAFQFGQLAVESDRLEVRTAPPVSSEFQKRVEGRLLPKLHPAIRQPITFNADFQLLGKSLFGTLRAFRDQLEIVIRPDHSGSLQIKDLNLADFFSTPLPQQLTVGIEFFLSEVDQVPALHFKPGRFELGRRKFELLTEVEPEENEFLVAVSNESPTLRYSLVNSARGIHQVLRSEPERPLNEIVAHVFLGKDWGTLDQAQREEVETLALSFTRP
jgi:hypothetical protein